MRVLPVSIFAIFIVLCITFAPSLSNWGMLIVGCSLWIALVSVVAYQSRGRD